MYFKDAGFPETDFGKIATDDYAKIDPKCPKIIRESWDYLMAMKTRKSDWPALKTVFNTCDPIQNEKDIDNLYDHLMNGFYYMAMTNYPYPTDFLAKMPANPTKVACDYFKDIPENPEQDKKAANGLSAREELVFGAVLKAANVYFSW